MGDTMSNLEQLSLTVGDIDLGGFDAESDHKLAEDFVRTSYVDAALSGKRTQMLGRKGSGKSALFTQLPRLAEEAGLGVSVLPLTPDSYAWSALRAYEEQGLLAEHAHTNAWKLTIAIELAGHLISLKHEWSDDARDCINALARFISENFGTLEPNMLSTATKVVKGLKAFNLSAFGFGVGFDRAVDSDLPLTPAVIEAILAKLVVPLGEHPVVVEFDRLDDSWDGTESSATLLVGLLKASKEVNDRFFAGDAQPPVRIVVFLRSDIYDSLRFDDKDKHRSSESYLLWNFDTLQEMLQNRLPEGLTVDKLFEDGMMRGGVTPFSHIVKRTFLRPREVLQFVDRCLTVAGDDAVLISKDSIRSAEETYSGWKVDDLKQEYVKVSPHFEPLIEALRQEVHRYDTFDELSEMLNRKVPDVVEQLGARGALEFLFDSSVIGIRQGGTGSTRFKSEDPDLRLPSSGAAYVHQGLYKGLNIVEARKPADTNAEEDDSIKVDS
jgi:hypothetical protein